MTPEALVQVFSTIVILAIVGSNIVALAAILAFARAMRPAAPQVPGTPIVHRLVVPDEEIPQIPGLSKESQAMAGAEIAQRILDETDEGPEPPQPFGDA